MGEKVGAVFYDVDLDTKKLIESERQTSRSLDRLGGYGDKLSARLSAVASAVSVLAAAIATVKVAKMADEFRLLGARVEVAAGGMEAGAAAMRELEAISKRTMTSVAGNAEVFQRLNQSILQMGGTQADTLQVTELLAKAIKVSGANAVESKAAMLQFGQALGSGKLAGDELRSLMETAPYLMRQLADGIGVPVGALKKLGEEGKLTADVVVAALGKAATKIEGDFAKFPITFDAAFTALEDAALRANARLDALTGTSAVLTGVTKGAAEVFDALADRLAETDGQASALGRSEALKNWANGSRVALSYLVDAADLVWQTLSVLGRNVAFVFTGIKTEIGGIAAQAVALAKGDLSGARAIGEAMKADAVQRRRELDAADAKTLARTKLAGQQMREAWEQGAGAGRGFINPQPAMSKLKTSGGDADKPKKAGATFDAAGYLAGLERATLDGHARIDAAEREALRKNDALLQQKKVSLAQHAEAEKLIREDAAQERKKQSERELDELVADINEKDAVRQQDANRRAAAEAKRQAQAKAFADYASGLTAAVNPIQALREEYEGKLDVVRQYETLMAMAGVEASEQAAAAKAQIEAQYEVQRRALAEQSFRSQGEANAFVIDSLNAMSATAANALVGLVNGTMTATDVMRALGGVILNEAASALVQMGMQQVKNALLSKTIEASERAAGAARAAAYTASVGAQVTGMSALAAQNAFAATAAIPIIGPGLAPAAAAAAGAAAAAIGAPAVASAPLAGARRYGGPVSAGSLYKINETGQPEMFTGANGSQYMLPTRSGRVTPADEVSGSPSITVIMQNTGTPQKVVSQDFDGDQRVLRLVMADLVQQFSSNTGPAFNALRGSTNLQSRL